MFNLSPCLDTTVPKFEISNWRTDLTFCEFVHRNEKKEQLKKTVITDRNWDDSWCVGTETNNENKISTSVWHIFFEMNANVLDSFLYSFSTSFKTDINIIAVSSNPFYKIKYEIYFLTKSNFNCRMKPKIEQTGPIMKKQWSKIIFIVISFVNSKYKF